MADPKPTRHDERLDLSDSIVVNLNELTAHPENYSFFTFRPNLKKLVLSGAEDSKHISILWYTASSSTVGLHYHAMTESVYTIDGIQRDAKGAYPTGSLYFNPPGSGHEISSSTGFFLLAYAAPADFINTNLIRRYTPVRLDVTSSKVETTYPFRAIQDGVQIYKVPLDSTGGISSQLVKSVSSKRYAYSGNYLLVLNGRCHINGTSFNAGMLIVAASIEAQSYIISAAEGIPCLLLGLSFGLGEEL
ncbi:MAG: cupin domain-containing protein [Elainellaceae cyanobacterium]